MIPIGKIVQLIFYQDMSIAREINESSRSYEVMKSFYYQTDKETKGWVPLYILQSGIGVPFLLQALTANGIQGYSRYCKCQFLTLVILCNRTSPS